MKNQTNKDSTFIPGDKVLIKNFDKKHKFDQLVLKTPSEVITFDETTKSL